MSEPSQVQKTPETSFLSEHLPTSSFSPLQSCEEAGVGQVEVRELTLCTRGQYKGLLSCVPAWNVSPTQPGHRPLWLWESADWLCCGLTRHRPCQEAQGGAAICFVPAEAAMGVSNRTVFCQVWAGTETAAGRPRHPEPSFQQTGSALWQVSQAAWPVLCLPQAHVSGTWGQPWEALSAHWL